MSKVLKAPEVKFDETEADRAMAAAVENAMADAYARGHAAGAAEATEGLQAEVARLREELASNAGAMQAMVAQHVTNDADALVRLGLDLATWFLESVPLTSPDAVLASLKPALEQLADEPALVLYLNPGVVEELGEVSVPGVASVRSDPSLQPSDYRLSSDGSTIERRWKDALADLAPELCAAVRVAADPTLEQGHSDG